MKAVLAALLLPAASALAAADAGTATPREPAIGDPAPDFELIGVDEETHRLKDFAGADWLLVDFTGTVRERISVAYDFPDARTLLRRATYDLTGLPPRPEEVAAFTAAHARDADAAVAALIDRLLASPHYGERMARHWLDVVRYADSSGFANDYERGNAWRYRDYVVRSFNAAIRSQ